MTSLYTISSMLNTTKHVSNKKAGYIHLSNKKAGYIHVSIKKSRLYTCFHQKKQVIYMFPTKKQVIYMFPIKKQVISLWSHQYTAEFNYDDDFGCHYSQNTWSPEKRTVEKKKISCIADVHTCTHVFINVTCCPYITSYLVKFGSPIYFARCK